MDQPSGPMGSAARVSRSIATNTVGRRVSVVLGEGEERRTNKEGTVTSFDPKTSKHRINFDNGEEKSLILNCVQFKLLVGSSNKAADDKGVRAARFRMAVKRDVVGRKLKVYHKKRDEWFDGTIVSLDGELDKYSIMFDSVKTPREVNLARIQFQWTDLIGPPSPSTKPTLCTSRYMGVQRHGVNTWLAFKSRVGQDLIGTFESEKDAALAHDVYAREGSDFVNFKVERITQADLEQRMAHRELTVTRLKTNEKQRTARKKADFVDLTPYSSADELEEDQELVVIDSDSANEVDITRAHGTENPMISEASYSRNPVTAKSTRAHSRKPDLYNMKGKVRALMETGKFRDRLEATPW